MHTDESNSITLLTLLETSNSILLTLSNWKVLCSHPPVDDHCGMMVNMQECHLVVFFPEDEENLQQSMLK